MHVYFEPHSKAHNSCLCAFCPRAHTGLALGDEGPQRVHVILLLHIGIKVSNRMQHKHMGYVL